MSTLVLVQHIHHGQFLQKHIPGAVLVTGKVNSKQREDMLASALKPVGQVHVTIVFLSELHRIGIEHYFEAVFVEHTVCVRY